MVRKFSVIVLAAAMLLGTVQASQAVLTAVGPTSPATGHFPVWYQDNNALSLELCLSSAPSPDPAAAGAPMCVLLPSPPYFDETLPAVFPVNFPDESFWFVADALLENGNATVSLRYVAALEAAFANGGVVNGDQVSFARIRIFADVPNPGTYTITHPYGVEVFNVPVTGPGREIQFTRDIGIGAPGNFTGALGGDIGPFLVRAAGTITVGTERFIGDPNVTQAVTGSPNNTNFLRIQGPGGINLQTDQFTLAGKVFSGVLPTNVAVDRATYSRSAAGAGTVDVFSTTDNTSYTLTFRDTIADASPPATITPMGQDVPATGKFYGRSAPASVPPYVIVKAVDPSGLATPTSLASNVVDVVKITAAQYDPVGKNLTIEASSSDSVVPLPTLTAVGYGPLAASSGTTTQRLVVPFVGDPPIDVPPARVTVKSSGGGADTEPVTVIPATATVPVAANDFATTPVNTPVTINALDNDTGTGTLTVVNLTQPANGSATIVGTTITYKPNNCFTGTDTFTYRASAGGVLSNVATVTVTVTAVLSTTPVAVNDGPVAVNQGAPTPPVDINVVGNDSAFGRTLRIFSVTQPPAGTGSVAILSDNVTVRYSPPPSLFGTVTFTYKVINDVCNVSTNSATVTVAVNGKPVANNVSATTPAGTPVTITLTATDPDGNTPLAYNITSTPSVGTVTNNGNGTVTYDPVAATNGTTVTFNYTATDTLVAVSNTATVTVLINSPLVARNDTATTQARTPVTINALDNDTGGTPPRTVINLTQPTNGGTTVLNANGTITYTPGGPGTGVCPSGTGTFTYQARDSVGGISNVATVTVTVNPRPETQTATASARITGTGTAARAEWTISGTTNVPTLPNGTPNTVTVRLNNTGQFIATANPDKAGRWKISLKGSTVVPPTTGARISVTSSYCNLATFPVTVR